MSCIEPSEYAGQLTLLECEEMCIARNCEYISRPSIALNTAKANCSYTSHSAMLTGNCQDNVYRNKKRVEGLLFSTNVMYVGGGGYNLDLTTKYLMIYLILCRRKL